MKITPYNLNYANFVLKPDRRQQNTPVSVDRRSGVDRRDVPRYILAPDQNLSGIDSNTQFIKQSDRRQQNMSVEIEKRSNTDRRKDSRFIPLYFGNENKNKTKEIFIGNVLPAVITASSVINNAHSGKINPLTFDSFISLEKSPAIKDNLTKTLFKKLNSLDFKDIKQNIMVFLSDTAVVVKKLTEISTAITTILMTKETIQKLFKPK